MIVARLKDLRVGMPELVQACKTIDCPLCAEDMNVLGMLGG